MNFKELRQQSGMTQKAFSEYFNIPKRTVENWESGQRECQAYLLELMEYKLEKEMIIQCKNSGFEIIHEEIKTLPIGECVNLRLMKEKPSGKMWFEVENGHFTEKLPPFTKENKAAE